MHITSVKQLKYEITGIIKTQIKYNSQSKLRVASTGLDEGTFHNLPAKCNLFRISVKTMTFSKVNKRKKIRLQYKTNNNQRKL